MGITIEMLTLHGIAGSIGVGSLALFFGTHVYSGFSDSLVIVLAILGIVGILLELHVIPGHFIAGAIGTIALLVAVVLAFGYGFLTVALQSLAVAAALSALMIGAVVADFAPERISRGALSSSPLKAPST